MMGLAVATISRAARAAQRACTDRRIDFMIDAGPHPYSSCAM
jgi:hypothetical protein